MKNLFIKKGKYALVILPILLLALSNLAQPSGVVVKRKDTKAEKRLALVIGNGTYRKADSLSNPVNDATDMTVTLKDLGFEVISGTNQTKAQMLSLIRDFGNRLAAAKAVGLFFYAGHGIAQNDTNYLIPVDADIQAEDEIEEASVSINFVLNKMAAANNGFNIVILDACRNNPFARKWRNYRDIGDKGGLTRIDAPTGTLIAYATKPGEVASDGQGRNGLYTSALLKQMRVKNVDITKMLQRVRADVIQQSGSSQVPFDESSLVGDFYFAGVDLSVVNSNPSVSSNLPKTGETIFWQAIENSDDIKDFEDYFSRVQSGEFTGTYKGAAELKLTGLRKAASAAVLSKLSNKAKFLLRYDSVWSASLDDGSHGFIVQLNGKFSRMDETGKEIVIDQSRPTLLRRGIPRVIQLNNKWGVQDEAGNVIVQPKYDFALHFDRNLAAVKLNNKWGFINVKGEEVIPLKYDDIKYEEYYETKPFFVGVAAVKLNNKWGFINDNDKIVIPIKYDDIWCHAFIKDGFFGVKLNGRKTFVDIYGNEFFDF